MATKQITLSNEWELVLDSVVGRINALASVVRFSDATTASEADTEDYDFIDGPTAFTSAALQIWCRADNGYAKIAVTTWATT